MKKNLFLLVLALGVISSAFAADEALKYSIGGPLIGTGFAYSTDPACLFDYNEANQTWTKTITVGTGTSNYFNIYTSDKKAWCYEYGHNAINGDCPSSKLIKDDWQSIEFTTKGVFPGITLTITEADGTPYMAISGFSKEVTVDSWSIAGDLAGSFSGSGTLSFEATSVAASDAFNVVAKLSDGSSKSYGIASVIEPSTKYTLVENGDPIHLDADYENVTLSFDPASLQLEFSGTLKQAPENNDDKYSLAGGLESATPVWTYSPDYLFSYDSENQVWTRTVTVGTGASNYFLIVDKDGNEWAYNVYSVTGDHAKEVLTKAYGNMSFNVEGGFTNITLTITEENGVPALAISGFQEQPAKSEWTINGTFTDGKDVSMEAVDGVWILNVDSVTTEDTFNIVHNAEDAVVSYGFDAPVVADSEYTLLENGNPIGFAKGYENLVITFDPEVLKLTLSGTPTVEPSVGTLLPTATVPTVNEKLTLMSPLTTLSFIFRQKEDGIDHLSRSEELSLVLKRNGEPVQTIPTTDRSRVFLNAKDPTQLDIVLDPVSQDGEYSITLPADFITLSGESGGAIGGGSDGGTETDLSKLKNAEYTLSFTILKTAPFTITPEPGEVKIDDLSVVKISYPEGTVVTKNSQGSLAPALYYYNAVPMIDGDGNVTYTREQRTTYSISVNANVVTLTSVNPQGITDIADNQSLRYYYLTVPAGLWTIDYDGSVNSNPNMTFERYTIKKEEIIDTNTVNITPSATSSVIASNLQSIEVSWPDTYSFNSWTARNPMGKRVGYIVGYLRQTASATDIEGTAAGQYKITEINIDARTMTLELDSDATLLPDGYYCIMLGNNIFVLPNNTKNQNMYFPGYDVKTSTTGIQAPAAESESFDLYTIQGVCVGRGLESFTDVLPGIYIMVKGSTVTKVIL